MVYVGIYGGLLIGLLGWYFGRVAARKKRGLDEMNTHIWSKARSTSWYFTAAAIYLLMTLEVTGMKLNLIPALSILLLVHLASWAIAGTFFSLNFISPDSPNNVVILSAIIGATFLLIFAIISGLTGNWKFLLTAIPPVIMITLISIAQARLKKHANPK